MIPNTHHTAVHTSFRRRSNDLAEREQFVPLPASIGWHNRHKLEDIATAANLAA